MLRILVNSFALAERFNLRLWWRERELLSPVQRFSEFIETVLLTEVSQNIVIFVDEIDSILSLKFNMDDFFAVIRRCYNNRAEQPDYKRLTFTLIGVATPSDLIQDKRRTPFNIGRAIKLTGFQLQEAQPLAQGLTIKARNPQTLLRAVLDSTGGQPFLTQKVCKLVLTADSPIPEGRETEWVEQLVQTKVIENWEAQDEPEHLKTIRDRIRGSEQRRGRLLGLYQQILQFGEITADDSPEQMELQLSGLVVKQQGKLSVYNRIYNSVFNRTWVEKELASVRPNFYSIALKGWLSSQGQEESWLLRGQLLQEAQKWAADNSLSDHDYRFLDASRELEQRDIQRRLEAEAEASRILAEANQTLKQANQKASQRIWIGSVVLVIFLVVAVFAGTWASVRVNDIQLERIRTQSLYSTALLNSNKDIDAMLTALKSAIQLKSVSWVNNTTKESASLALQEAIFNVRERNRLEGHNDAVRSVKFSPDNQTIATASEDNTVRLWNIDGRELKRLPGQNQSFRRISFSPDGKMIAAISADNTIKAWDIRGKELITLNGKDNADNFMSSLCISPDGKVIAAPSEGNTVKLWSTSGRELKILKGHEISVWSVSCSPDGKTIVTADEGGVVKIWSTDGRELKTFRASKLSIYDVSFSPDGKSIATAAGDTTVKLWSLDGQEIRTLSKHDNYVTSVSFSPDGRTIASTSADKTVKLWSATGQELKTFRGHNDTIFSASFSPNGKFIAFAAGDNTVKLWSIDNEQKLKTFVGHRDSLWSVSFSPNGKIIASAGDDRTIRLWSLDGQEPKIIKADSDKLWNRIWSLSFSPDGNTIATSNYDKTIKLWNLDGQNLKTFKRHKSEVTDVSFSPNGQTLASASYDGTVKLWRVEGQELRTLKASSGKVWSVRFSPDGKTLASAHHDGTVKLWNLQGQLLRTIRGHGSYVRSVRFSPDGKIIASANHDKTVKLWSLEGQELKILKGHSAEVTKLSFSPDSKILASSSADGTIRLWSVTDGQEIKTFQGHGYPYWDVSFSPDGKKIVSVSDDALVELWNAETLNEEQLIDRGCNWLHDYLKHNSNVDKADRHICDQIKSGVSIPQ